MLSPSQCAPYLSATLLAVEQPATVGAIRKQIVELLGDGPKAGGDRAASRIHKASHSTFSHGELEIGWIAYSETRPPAWYRGSDLKEEYQHVVFIVKKEDLVALTFSDPAFRTYIVTEIRKRRSSPLDRLKTISAKQISDAFVGNRVRTLWLSGAHRRTPTKADSKILSGPELETALDPLEDQSYYFSSVRSTLGGESPVASGREVVVGANPRSARVWLRPSKDWEDFLRRSEALLDAAAAAIKRPSKLAAPLPVLAQAMEGLANASAPYDMAIIVPEAMSAGAEDNVDDAWLHEFSDAARFEVKAEAGSASFEAEIFWHNESYGRIRYEFSEGSDALPSMKAAALDWKIDADHQDAIRKICENKDLLTVYYDTGHTFSRGLFYETRFRDARFSGWEWTRLGDFEIGSEKPLDGKRFAVENLGNPADKSLFGFVAKHWPNHQKGRKPTGWLVCDDGSMESADFIHFDDAKGPPHLTLIHVKGSGSSKPKRGLSVSDYEVVVGQAVKNVRYLDRSHIGDKLAANKDNSIGSAVWRDGERQKNRDQILKILAETGSNMTKTVYVFQPRARRTEVESIGDRIARGDLARPDVRRLQQLDALLLAARAECFGLGAEFRVIGQDDST